MTDQPRREDPTLASFGRHLFGGGVLGLCVGASWEIMAWLWAPGQFPPLRLLIWGTLLGNICGFVIWCARAGREPLGNGLNGPRRRSAAPGTPRHASTKPIGVALTWRSFWAHVAVGAVAGVLCVPSYVATYWTANSGQRVFAVVGCVAFGVGIGVLVWLARAGYVGAKAERTSRGTDPIGPGKHPGEPPAAFDHRLAAFLHCSQQELSQPRPRLQSRMPFWSIVDVRSYVGPKPVWIIRRILERIRATLQRSR